MRYLSKALFIAALAITPAGALADDHIVETGLINQETRIIEGGGGLPIAMTVAGNPDGPAIVLLHSLLGSTLNWAKQFDGELLETHRVVSIDIRGHGASAKPWIASAYQDTQLFAEDIDAAIRASGVEKPTLVAWAYGGLFAMDYVRHFGDTDIAGIVIVEGNGGLTPLPKPADTPEYRQRVANSKSPNIAVIDKWTSEFGDYLMRSEALPVDEAEMIRTSSMMVPHYVRDAFRDRPDDNSDLVETIQTPVMFVVTMQEGPSVDMVSGIAGSLANGSVATVETNGSLSFWYDPTAFDAVLADFVAANQ